MFFCTLFSSRSAAPSDPPGHGRPRPHGSPVRRACQKSIAAPVSPKPGLPKLDLAGRPLIRVQSRNAGSEAGKYQHQSFEKRETGPANWTQDARPHSPAVGFNSRPLRHGLVTATIEVPPTIPLPPQAPRFRRKSAPPERRCACVKIVSAPTSKLRFLLPQNATSRILIRRQ